MKTIKIAILTIVGAMIGGFSLAQRGGVIGVGGVDLPGVDPAATSAESDVLITDVIQTAINRVLGILAFIALLILMYAGFLMLTAAGDDEKYGKGFNILKQVALGLAFIGLAWLVVSMIFYLIDLITQ